LIKIFITLMRLTFCQKIKETLVSGVGAKSQWKDEQGRTVAQPAVYHQEVMWKGMSMPSKYTDGRYIKWYTRRKA